MLFIWLKLVGPGQSPPCMSPPRLPRDGSPVGEPLPTQPTQQKILVSWRTRSRSKHRDPPRRILCDFRPDENFRDLPPPLLGNTKSPFPPQQRREPSDVAGGTGAPPTTHITRMVGGSGPPSPPTPVLPWGFRGGMDS
jgi:hypothetical protein